MADKLEKLGKTKLFGAISKFENQSDGTLIVEGYASSGSVDHAGEIVTPDAMKAALPEYMQFANIREMHKADAAGVALHAEVQDDGRTFLRAHVVDPVAVLKVRTSVYKGFSIGGNVTERDPVVKTSITGLRLVEISLVDRPCNPDAVFECFKAEGADGDNENDGSTGDGETVESGEGGDEKPKAKPKGEDGGDDAGDDKDKPKPKDDDEADKAIATGDLAKGHYAISDLAELCERLEQFGHYQHFEASFEEGSEAIANEAHAIAIKLYALLLKLVSADVARAKERLSACLADSKAAGLKAVLDDAIAKIGIAAPAPADAPDVVAIVKAAGLDDAALDTIEKVVAETVRLRKAEDEWKAAPAPAKGALTAVTKTGEADPLTTKTDDAPVTDPLAAIKKVLAGGGVPIGR